MLWVLGDFFNGITVMAGECEADLVAPADQTADSGSTTIGSRSFEPPEYGRADARSRRRSCRRLLLWPQMARVVRA